MMILLGEPNTDLDPTQNYRMRVLILRSGLQPQRRDLDTVFVGFSHDAIDG